ncbi:MAG: exosortase-associated EpsI family protein [Candidatus Omnitrophica bacterium]|nr:exosortase-associated EpsI family protein [Candidatus Omnitrophota bacterium]
MEKKYKNIISLCAFIGLFALTGALSIWLAQIPMVELPSIDLPKIPLSFDGWTGKDQPLDGGEQAIARTTDILKRTYMDENGNEVWLIAVSAAKSRHSVHHPKYCYTGTGWNIVRTQQGLGKKHLATEVLLSKRVDGVDYQNLERYWFTDGIHVEPSYFFQLYTAFRVRLLERQLPNWSLIRIVLEDASGTSEEKEFLQSFGDALMETILKTPDILSLASSTPPAPTDGE